MHVDGEAPNDGIEDLIMNADLPHLVPSKSNGHLLRDAVLSCPAGETACFLVLMPLGSIEAEHARK